MRGVGGRVGDDVGMAKGYKLVDREQGFLLPPDMREWLPEGHLAWFVIDAVAALDTSAFHVSRRLGGVGRQGWDPDMLLALLVYCYAGGVRSSRQIERMCQVDVACRVICANLVPDHSAVARFRAEHEVAFRELFAMVTALCLGAGMGRMGVLAVDGTKIEANASRLANRTLERVRAEIDRVVAEAAAVDAAEDAEWGERRGDELPVGLAGRQGRVERLRRCAEELQAQAAASPRVRKTAQRLVRAEEHVEETVAVQQAKVDRYAEAVAAGQRPRRRPVPAGEHCLTVRARERLARARTAHEQAVAAAGRSRSGRLLRRNVTDPDSQVLRSQGRWVQGYNCQAAFAEDGVAVAADIARTASDVEMLHPVVDQARQRAATAGRAGEVERVVADAGYYSADNVAADLARDTDSGEGEGDTAADTDADAPLLLVPPPRTTHPTETATDADAADEVADADAPFDPAEAMRRRLATPEGKATYARRAPLAEGPFGQIKAAMGFTRFARRGRSAAEAEWHLVLAVRNLLLLHRAGHALPAPG